MLVDNDRLGTFGSVVTIEISEIKNCKHFKSLSFDMRRTLALLLYAGCVPGPIYKSFGGRTQQEAIVLHFNRHIVY
jgi:hypothetical protein